jgi:dipeptidyl aminopeptidase/acylaminoacyl peptidase
LGNNPVRSAIALAGPTDFYPFTSRRAIDAMSKAPDPLATQPINFVRKDAPPILLLHGTADTVVRVRNANSLYTKQTAAGGIAEIRRYEGASHNDLVLALSTLFRGKLPVVSDSVQFLNTHNQVAQKADKK